MAMNRAGRLDKRQDLVLLHGWGSTAAVWARLASALEADFAIHCFELPGHGASCLRETRLEALALELAQAVAVRCSSAAVWLGWSLGGLVALRVVLSRPEVARALLLMATTPRFTRPTATAGQDPGQGTGQNTGMPAAEFDAFYQRYLREPRRALRRFIVLQAHGDMHARQVARQLSAAASTDAGQRPGALTWGLECLRDNNLWPEIPALKTPTHALFGGDDALLSPRLAVALAAHRNIHVHVWPGAGHAPFLSAPERFAAWVRGAAGHA